MNKQQARRTYVVMRDLGTMHSSQRKEFIKAKRVLGIERTPQKRVYGSSSAPNDLPKSE